MSNDPLSARLFGYGVPYRVRLEAGGEVAPLPTDPLTEAARLARELGALTGTDAARADTANDAWALSMPFGRCGVQGLPLEHLMVYHQTEAYLEILSPDGVEVHALRPGQLVTLKPGRVARIRAKPRSGRQIVVAFQTEDRTPLQGNAAPFCPDGDMPDGYAERLRYCHAAFQRVRSQACVEAEAYTEALERFFQRMAHEVATDPAVLATQETARATGTYDVDDQIPLFERQQALVSPAVLQRIAAGDPEIFRFPGMFGGVTTLNPLITSG